jgi:integrase
MKGRKTHRIPLSAAAIDLLRTIPRVGDRVFPIDQQGMRRRVLAKVAPDATVHGMRAAFRTWCSESTSFSPKLAEAALAHKLGDNKTEETYLRGTLFEKRRKLMEAWGAYCSKPAIARGEVVVPIREAHSVSA